MVKLRLVRWPQSVVKYAGFITQKHRGDNYKQPKLLWSVMKNLKYLHLLNIFGVVTVHIYYFWISYVNLSTKDIHDAL